LFSVVNILIARGPGYFFGGAFLSGLRFFKVVH